MIGQIIGAVGGLATSYLDGKTAIQKANAEIKLKQATGEMDWEQSAIEASKDSWKDELWTIVFVAILCANFIPTIIFGVLTGFAMFVALIAVLTLLPRMLVSFKPI